MIMVKLSSEGTPHHHNLIFYIYLPSLHHHSPSSFHTPPCLHSSPPPPLPNSPILTMSKDCGNHGREKLCRVIGGCIFLLVIIVLLVVLIIYLVLRPHKPYFYLQDASILAFNLSAPNTLSTNLQVTISTRNPNDRIGIYYDTLNVYASYRYQQITLATGIIPHYQGHNDVDVWSPYLRGDGIPIAPFLAEALVQDESDGFFFLWVKIDGRIRWKVGTWTSGHYHLFVNCPTYLSFDRSKGSSSNPAVRFQQVATCTVDL